RFAAEMLYVVPLSNFDLGTPRFYPSHQRQKTVRRPACDDIDGPRILERPKTVYQIALIAPLEHLERCSEMIQVHPRRRIDRGPASFEAAGSHHLLFAQLDQLFEVSNIAVLQQRIDQHLA